MRGRPASSESNAMIRIAISVEAFEAIAKTLRPAASGTRTRSTASFTAVIWYQAST